MAGLAWAGIGAGRLQGRVGGGGCIVIVEFGMEGLHRGRWVEVDVVGEGVGL